MEAAYPGASVNENYAVRVIDNKWDQVDAWNTVGADDPKTGWVTLKFDQSYPLIR